MLASEAVALAGRLFAAHPEKLGTPGIEVSIQVYAEGIQDLDYQTTRVACAALTREMKWIPKIAEIRERVREMDGTSIPTLDEAVASILQKRAKVHPLVESIGRLCCAWDTVKDFQEERFRSLYEMVRQSEEHRANEAALHGVEHARLTAPIPASPKPDCAYCWGTGMREVTIERNGQSYSAMEPCPCRAASQEVN